MQSIRQFKVALLQNAVFKQKTATLNYVREKLTEAAANDAKVCFLGEVFNSLYNKQYLYENAEDFANSESRETYDFLAKSAKDLKLYILGSMPEKADSRYFNTGFCFDSNGQMVAKYRKVHLFDIDIPGRITYKESDTFSAGSDFCVFDTPLARFGIAICYDIRFPEFAQVMRQKGAEFIFYPGAFNQTTGPLHWELLLRARAVDQQVYVAGVSTARYKDDPEIYQAWGHSTLVDPVGQVIAKAGQDPELLYGEVNLEKVDEIRKNIPTSQQRRPDLYQLQAQK